MPPTSGSPHPRIAPRLRKAIAPLTAAAVAFGAVASPIMATPAIAAANAPADNFTSQQLQNTLNSLIKTAQKIATADGRAIVTEADIEQALSALGNKAWEQGVDFALTGKHSGGLGDISVYTAPDGTLGIALSTSTGDGCALTTLAPGDKKATLWSFDTALGKSCSGKVAALGKTADAPPFLDPVPPAPLTGVTVTSGDSELSVTWPASAADDLGHYNVYVNGEKVGESTSTRYTVTGLTNYTTYVVTVTAFDEAENESDPSSPVTGTPVDLTPPPVPTALTAEPGDGTVTLTWAASAADDLDRYNVVDADGTVLATVPAGTLTATLDGLTNDLAYTLAVVAVDLHDNASDPSAAVLTTPTAGGALPVEGVWSDLEGDMYGTPNSGAAVERLGANTLTRRQAPSISADGRYVLFGTQEQLEASDTNLAYELYVKDRENSTVKRLRPLPSTWTNRHSDDFNYSWATLSPGGQHALVATKAPLTSADTNTVSDLYRVDVATGEADLASVPTAGTVSAVAGVTQVPGGQSQLGAIAGDITADGRYVFFTSARSDLVPGDTNSKVDVFRKDLDTGAVDRLYTVDSPVFSAPTVTPDGRTVISMVGSKVYRSNTDTMVSDVLMAKALYTGGYTADIALNVNAYGAPHEPLIDISDDGRYVMYASTERFAPYLRSSNYRKQVYRYDTTTRLTQVANPKFLDIPNNGRYHTWPTLDPTGRYGFFTTSMDEETGAGLLGNPGLTGFAVYRTDFETGEVTLAISDQDGKSAVGGYSGAGHDWTAATGVTATGEVLLQTPYAMTSSDYNATHDTFVKNLDTGFVTSVVPGTRFDPVTVSDLVAVGATLVQTKATPDGGKIHVVKPNSGKSAAVLFGHLTLSDNHFGDVTPTAASRYLVRTSDTGEVRWITAATPAADSVLVLPDGDLVIQVAGTTQTRVADQVLTHTNGNVAFGYVARLDGDTGKVAWAQPVTATEGLGSLFAKAGYDAARNRIVVAYPTTAYGTAIPNDPTYQLGSSTLTRSPNGQSGVLVVALDASTGDILAGHKPVTGVANTAFDPTAVAVTPDGSVFVAVSNTMAGYYDRFYVGDQLVTYGFLDDSTDSYVVKVNADLTGVDYHRVVNASTSSQGPYRYATVNGMVATPDNDIVFGGYAATNTTIGGTTMYVTGTSGKYVGFLATLDGVTGSWQGVVKVEGKKDMYASPSARVEGVTALANGNVAAAVSQSGTITVTSPGQAARTIAPRTFDDFAVIEVDPATGSAVHAARYGGRGLETLNSISTTRDGAVSLGGKLAYQPYAQSHVVDYSASGPVVDLPSSPSVYEVGFALDVPAPSAETDTRFKQF